MQHGLHLKLRFLFLIIGFTHALLAQTSFVTQHADVNRTGWYAHEKILSKDNVKPGSFGLLFTRPVDDQVYAQPLVMMKVDIPSIGKRNVMFIATVNNSVYAYDADSANVTNPYWEVHLSPPGGRAAVNSDIASVCGGYYQDFSGNMGIVGTPVIDTTANTLYLVAKSYSGSDGFQQYLHALDVRTGQEKANSPVKIDAQVSGSGDGSLGGTIHFDALKQNQRSGLLLLDGIVYITWASHGDCDPYHGWIIGYDHTTLAQKIVYNVTPEGYKGGIWMSGCGIAADESGSLYVAVGNGSVGLNNDPTNVVNRSESALKLTPSGSTLAVSSYFTPTDYPYLEDTDGDFGVTGILLIPGSSRAMAGAKDGQIYLMDRDNMGGFSASSDQVLQTFNQNISDAHNLTSLTYYQGESQSYVYLWSDNAPLRAIPFDPSSEMLELDHISSSSLQGPVGYNGAFLSVSSNGSDDNSAILWTSYAASGNANQETRPGILRALSATDINAELWNSSLVTRDDPGNYAKFNCPTIANGKVYLATFSNKVCVYGLLSNLVTSTQASTFESFIVSPNPAGHMIRIIGRHAENMNYRIIDAGGRLVQSGKTEGEQQEIMLNDLPDGLYILEVNDAGLLSRRKFVIRR